MASTTAQIQVTEPTGVSVTSAIIDWGDGTSSNLGALNGSITVSHPYTRKGNTLVTLTVVDTLSRTSQGFTTINIP